MAELPRRGNPRFECGPMPAGVVTTVLSMTAADGARVPGVLYRVPDSRTVVTLMHPRLDVSRHYLTALLAEAGVSVLAQGTRSTGSDLTLVHEEALLDAGAGMVRARDLGFEHVVAVGASGGGPLYAFYTQQASRSAATRITHTPAGDAIDLRDAELPVPDGVVFLATHPGQGELLLGCIDPAVADELNPRATVARLDLFDTANGFVAAPGRSSYTPEFLLEYRSAQRARVARIDARALELVAERRHAAERWSMSKDDRDRRCSGRGEVILVYRTDADPRTVDLTIDPSDRPYGSVYGSRPDLGNVGIAGFGRLTTPEAWLSTWSGHHSNARFLTCAPDIATPTLFIEYTGDQACFPSESAAMFEAIAATDKRHVRIRGMHFGGSIVTGEPPGGLEASAEIARWVATRFELGAVATCPHQTQTKESSR